jgi:hypothetical protein
MRSKSCRRAAGAVAGPERIARFNAMLAGNVVNENTANRSFSKE